MSDIDLPQPSEITYKEKERAMAAYLMMFATAALGLPLPFINLVAALVYYYFIKESSRFVKFHSFQSLISQIPISILNGALITWAIRNFLGYGEFNDIFWGYLIAIIVFNVIYVIFSLIAAFKSYNGRMYYFLFFGRIAYREAFKKSFGLDKSSVVNKPPQ